MEKTFRGLPGSGPLIGTAGQVSFDVLIRRVGVPSGGAALIATGDMGAPAPINGQGNISEIHPA